MLKDSRTEGRPTDGNQTLDASALVLVPLLPLVLPLVLPLLPPLLLPVLVPVAAPVPPLVLVLALVSVSPETVHGPLASVDTSFGTVNFRL